MIYRTMKPETVARRAKERAEAMAKLKADLRAHMEASAAAENDPEGFWTLYLAETIEAEGGASCQ